MTDNMKIKTICFDIDNVICKTNTKLQQKPIQERGGGPRTRVNERGRHPNLTPPHRGGAGPWGLARVAWRRGSCMRIDSNSGLIL